MRILIAPIIISILIIGACTADMVASSESIEVRTDKSSYILGEEGKVIVTNLRKGHFGAINDLCLLMREQWIEGEWEPVVAEQGYHVCLLARADIPRGQTVSSSFRISEPSYSPGEEYRFVIYVTDSRTGEPIPVYSPGFAVEDSIY